MLHVNRATVLGYAGGDARRRNFGPQPSIKSPLT